MIKKVTMALVAAASVVFAGIQNEGFRQVTNADINTGVGENNGSQFWWPANGFSLKVPAHTEVWISNVINYWSHQNAWNQAPYPDLVDEGVYQMTSDKFGYYTLDENFHSGTSKTMTLTYTNDKNNNQSSPTTGYLLGSFDKDTEIFLAMTPIDGTELVNSYQYVRGNENPNTTLENREWQLTDFAGNIRMEWGFYGLTPSGREFTIAYKELEHNSGQPLPGGLVAGLLAFGTITVGSLKKKRS